MRTNLPARLEKLLAAHAAVAAAAGVSSLALSQAAEAKIVYTPAKIPIVVNAGFVELDLNHDGINDFQFLNIYGTHKNSTLNVSPARNVNRIWAVSCTAQGPPLCAAALPNGTEVGPRSPFQRGHSSLAVAGYVGGSIPSFFGRWIEVKQAYLGLKFMIKGKPHFGWARVRMGGHSKPGWAATITGYAYETAPNKPIVAGKTDGPDVITGQSETEPGSLGHLALGRK